MSGCGALVDYDLPNNGYVSGTNNEFLCVFGETKGTGDLNVVNGFSSLGLFSSSSPPETTLKLDNLKGLTLSANCSYYDKLSSLLLFSA